MRSIRRYLSWLVWSWVLCQAIGLAAAPLALRGLPVAAPHEEEACCPGVGPGQVCPMHHAHEGAKRCVMTNACSGSPSALLSLAGGLGLLPPASIHAVRTVSFGPVAPATPPPVARALSPDPPPPRA
jgi:hypothetical protein